MTKLESIEHKIFASEAPLDEIGQFGSALDTTKLNTKDVTTIQALPAYTKGWGSAVISDSNYPTMEEMNGVLNVMSYHTGYLYQEGMPAWRSDREYSATSIVKEPSGTKFFHSLKDGNIGNALDNTEYWEELKLGGSGLELCDIGMALYVDETKGLRRYLNGQIVDINTNTQAFLNRLKEITTLHPSLLCTEDEWQTAKTMSAFGQVGKFVFNYSGSEIVSVRLPRVVNVQGLFDLQNLGMTVEAGLPNHSHIAVIGDYWTTNQSGFAAAGTHCYRPSKGETTDASLSNPIYGNSDTVQPEAIQYPYFIQIATGSETEANIVNTLENVNGFTLLESKYSDKPLYNECWLLSNGQYNAKSVYPTAYEGLQVEHNTGIEAGTTVTLPSGVSYTKRGLSVKLSTETYTDYDFVLNTADETFRLPLLNGSEDLISNRYDNLELLASDSTYTAHANGWYSIAATGRQVRLWNSKVGNGGGAYTADFANMVSVPVKKGDTVILQYETCSISASWCYFRFTYAQGNGSLYFYVGETVQNANLIDAGRIGEQLANKADLTTPSIQASYLKTSYINGTSGYRIWSDGYCEQWGEITVSGAYTVSLLKTFSNTNYQVLAQQSDGASNSQFWNSQLIQSKNTTSFKISFYQFGGYWRAYGYLAEGEY